MVYILLFFITANMTSLQSKFSTNVPNQTNGIETDASACDAAVDVTTIDYQNHQEYHQSEEHSDSITSDTLTSLEASDTEVSEETIKVQSLGADVISSSKGDVQDWGENCPDSKGTNWYLNY